MFRKLTAKRHSVGSVAAPVLSPGDKEEQQLMAGFMESLAKYQDVMRQLQTQAKLLMMVSLQTLSHWSLVVTLSLHPGQRAQLITAPR